MQLYVSTFLVNVFLRVFLIFKKIYNYYIIEQHAPILEWLYMYIHNSIHLKDVKSSYLRNIV